jgi:hypothetical protein
MAKKKAPTKAQLKKQMTAARKEASKAADAIVKGFKAEFGEDQLPDFKLDDGEILWDIDYDDEDQVAQTEWLDAIGLTPDTCKWLWW